jgi:hypothetical protein
MSLWNKRHNSCRLRKQGIVLGRHKTGWLDSCALFYFPAGSCVKILSSVSREERTTPHVPHVPSERGPVVGFWAPCAPTHIEKRHGADYGIN